MFTNKTIIKQLAEKHPGFSCEANNTQNNVNGNCYLKMYKEVNRLKTLAQRYQDYYSFKSEIAQASYNVQHFTLEITHTPYKYSNIYHATHNTEQHGEWQYKVEQDNGVMVKLRDNIAVGKYSFFKRYVNL